MNKFTCVGLVLSCFLLNACKVVSKQKNITVKIDSIIIFNYFNQRGFTTMGAYTHFDDMRKQEIQQLYVSAVDIEKLQQIMNSAKQMKHFQRKLAGGLIFCEIQFAEQTLPSRVIIGIGAEVSGIMDLTARKDYVVRNPLDIKWLSDFRERMKAEAEKK